MPDGIEDTYYPDAWRPDGTTRARTSTILIAEDDPIVALDLKEQAALEGYAVSGPFRSSCAAISSLTLSRPELAIIDYKLEGGVADALMEVLHQQEVPFIVVTVSSKVRFPDGVAPVSVFSKPFSLNNLSKLMDEILRTKTVDSESILGSGIRELSTAN